MSLFTDLKDVFTAYAQRIKGLAAADEEIKADLGSKTGFFTWVNRQYIDLTTDPVDLTPISNNVWRHTVVDCVAGDKFVINATGGNAPRAWGFIDSSNHILSVANAQATVVDLELTAPTNAVKLIISDKSGGMSYKVGNNLASKVSNLEKIEAGIPEDVKAALLECLGHVYWDDNLGETHYANLENALNGVPTEIWSWSTEYTGDGRLKKGYPVMDKTLNGIRKGFQYIAGDARFGIYTDSGKQCAIDTSTGDEVVDVFPIPIPSTATKVTITVTPATDYLYGYIGKYVNGSGGGTGYDYTIINGDSSWSYKGIYECTFEAQKNLFLGYNGKKADGSNYTAAERNNRVVTVTFE